MSHGVARDRGGGLVLFSLQRHPDPERRGRRLTKGPGGFEGGAQPGKIIQHDRHADSQRRFGRFPLSIESGGDEWNQCWCPNRNSFCLDHDLRQMFHRAGAGGHAATVADEGNGFMAKTE